MDKKTFTRKYNALKALYIAKTNKYNRGDIVIRSGKKVVILEPTGIYAWNNELTYDVLELTSDGRIAKEGKIYGFETVVSTGKTFDLKNTQYEEHDDDCI